MHSETQSDAIRAHQSLQSHSDACNHLESCHRLLRLGALLLSLMT